MDGVVSLYVHASAHGAWNMAVDEWLLEQAGQGRTSLRFYEWSPAALSLGYFQNHADRQTHAASADIFMTRRHSGGGTIIHDYELTYSLALPLEHSLARSVTELYLAVHRSLIATLAENWGLQAALCDPAAFPSSDQPEPFLCFLRRSLGDVLLGADKICGSAQRRRNKAVLLHGSVLLAKSPHAPELSGISEHLGRPLTRNELEGAWRPHWERLLQSDLQAAELPAPALSVIEEIMQGRFLASDWIFRR